MKIYLIVRNPEIGKHLLKMPQTQWKTEERHIVACLLYNCYKRQKYSGYKQNINKTVVLSFSRP